MSVTSELYAPTDQDQEWLSNLDKTVAGRNLNEHFMCVDYSMRNKNRVECPVQQVGTFRRVLCSALAMNDRVCGLPRPMPKYLAVVNLSGYRALLYSSRACLIRLLCIVGVEANERMIENVEKVLQYADAQECSVMVCLSLPWQAGVHMVHWEVRTVERLPDGTIRDGALMYAYSNEAVRKAAATAGTEAADSTVIFAQIEAFKKSYVACDIDFTPSEVSSQPVNTGKMAEIIEAVQKDRKRLLADMGALKEEHALVIQGVNVACDARVGSVINQAQRTAEITETKIAELERHILTLREQNSSLGIAKAEAERVLAEKELLWGGEKHAMTSKAKVAEMSARAAGDKLGQLQKHTNRERDQAEKAHSKMLEDAERRFSSEQMKVRQETAKLEAALEAQRRLGDVCDQLRAEKQALTYETIRSRRGILCHRATLAIARLRFEQLSESAAAAQLEQAQMLEESRSKVRHHKRVPPKSFLPEEPATSDMEVQTEGQTAAEQKLQEELSDLSNKFAALHDEKDALQKRLEEAETRGPAKDSNAVAMSKRAPALAPAPAPAASRPQENENASGMVANGGGQVQQRVYNQVYNQVLIPQGTFMQQHPPMDLGSDPAGDIGLETLIGQTQATLRTLVNMARQGASHKHAADNMWSELQAMKRFTGSDGMGGWQSSGYFDTLSHWAPNQNGQPVPVPVVHNAQPAAQSQAQSPAQAPAATGRTGKRGNSANR